MNSQSQKVISMSVAVPLQMARQIRILAAQRGESRSALIRHLIGLCLEENQPDTVDHPRVTPAQDALK